MNVDNNTLAEIKRVVLYYYSEFFDETQDKSVAIELTKEAMLTYRTLLIGDQKKEREDKPTERQIKLLEESLNNFRENKIIAEELNRLGKSTIYDLTKKEATELISKIISR